MFVENNVSLGSKTTFGLGGVCSQFIVPESIDEAIDAFRKNPEVRLLAGGSNVVINDLHSFDCVISLLEFNKEIHSMGNGVYRVGASVRNQQLIRQINADGFGGIEYLFSVPGTIGGAIFMNAGTGKATGACISQHIRSVEWFDGEKVVTLSCEQCQFSYRDSFFRQKKGMIISTVMEFQRQTAEESQKQIQERKEKVNQLQDRSGKSCGTLCKVSNRNIMRVLKLIRYGKKEGVHFSGHTPNWLVNCGGNYQQFSKCIRLLKYMHRLFKQKVELEIEVWQ